MSKKRIRPATVNVPPRGVLRKGAAPPAPVSSGDSGFDTIKAFLPLFLTWRGDAPLSADERESVFAMMKLAEGYGFDSSPFFELFGHPADDHDIPDDSLVEKIVKEAKSSGLAAWPRDRIHQGLAEGLEAPPSSPLSAVKRLVMGRHKLDALQRRLRKVGKLVVRMVARSQAEKERAKKHKAGARAVGPQRRKAVRTVRPLTPRQTEALAAWGEADGNVSKAARTLKVSRPTAWQHIRAALKKLQMTPARCRASLKARRLAVDRRGNVAVPEEDLADG